MHDDADAEPPQAPGGADDAASTVHEYDEDDYDPATEQRAGRARDVTDDLATGARTTAAVDDGAAVGDAGGEPSVPRQANVKRIVIGLVGIVLSLLVANVGLNILSQPDDSPATSIPAQPGTTVSSRGTTPTPPTGSKPPGTAPG